MRKELIANVLEKYRSVFTGTPLIIRSPGRLRLLGEHTDYNEGFVLAGAVDRELIMALQLRDDDQIHMHALEPNQHHITDIHKLERSSLLWPDYILAIIDTLKNRDYQLKGFNCVIGANIPARAGFSLSAALEGAVLLGIDHLCDLAIDKNDMAKIGYLAEHNFLQIQCGLTNQYVNFFGREGNVLRIDSRSRESLYYPFDGNDFKMVVCDTGIRGSLDHAECQTRRRQCDEGVTTIKNLNKNILSLRDISHYLLDQKRMSLERVVFKRCTFVIRENIRVLNASTDLEKQDYKKLGLRMSESHLGLLEEYEVCSREQDLLVKMALDLPGVLGARMMGSGFGGATMNLVEADHAENFSQQIAAAYLKRTQTGVDVYATSFGDGVSIIS